MKGFKDFLESEAPASVDSNVGKPDGGKVKKKPSVWTRPTPEDFAAMFKGASDELKKVINK